MKTFPSSKNTLKDMAHYMAMAKMYKKRKVNYSLSKPQKTEVKKLIKRHEQSVVELKRYDVSVNHGYLSYSPMIAPLSAIPLGSDDGERDSDEVLMKGLDLSYGIYCTQSTTVSNNVQSGCRVVLLRWNVDDATIPPTADNIFELNTVTYPQLSMISPFNSVSIDQGLFTVLGDMRYSLSPTANNVNYHKRKRFPGNGYKVHYTPGLDTGTGNLYLIALSDHLTGLGSHADIYYSTRVSYNDA